MDDELVTLQISADYRDKLRTLAKADIRSMKGEFEWLIDQEFCRRYVPMVESVASEPTSSISQ